MTMHLLPDLLRESALKHPDRKAIVYKDRSLSYADLENRSSRFGAALSGEGISKGDRVGIMLHKSIESIIALFGIMKAGAIYVPLDPGAPAVRVNAMLSHCGIECLVTSPEIGSTVWRDQQTPVPLKKLILTGGAPGDNASHRGVRSLSWEAMESAAPGNGTPVEMADTAPAYILHTSGSTGVPKGVVISHLNAMTFVNMATDVFSLNENDRIANHAPLHFDLSVFDIFGAIRSGAALVIIPETLSPFAAKLAEYIDKEGITIWNSVSSVLALLADRGRLDRFSFDALRLAHFSGDVMPVKYLRVLMQHMKRARFYNIYGQTEANSSLFYPVPDIPGNEAGKIPIGKPFPNFDVFALNDAQEPISRPGEEGELYVNASTVAVGYWNNEEMTREKFVPDPRHPAWSSRVYRTGDAVRIDAEGNYLFIGRKDHMIKSRGHRIELAEIEGALNSHADVSCAVVLAVPDALAGNRIVAYVSPAEGTKPSPEEIADHCRLTLPGYMVPEEIFVVGRMPRTTTGKADRKQMQEAYLNRAVGQDILKNF